MSRSSQRRGFSVVELLLVLVLAGVLLGLLVPAAYGLQQTAHRQATVNNLKQICLATHGYNDVYKVLPPGYLGPARKHNNPADPVAQGPTAGYFGEGVGIGVAIGDVTHEHRAEE